jgi:hypothetical protein
MLYHWLIHQVPVREIRDVSTCTAQHVGAARQSIWSDVTLPWQRPRYQRSGFMAWRYVAFTKKPTRFKHVTSILCYLRFTQYAWRCQFFFSKLINFPYLYQSTISPYSFVYLPQLLKYNPPSKWISPVSIIPPQHLTHLITHNKHSIIYFSN